jgi:branched-chain amino acid transport system permease protein
MTGRARPATLLVAGAIAAAVVFVVNANRGPAPYSWENVATFLIVGLSLGGIYAISAGGLVVTHITTGVFNFAHGAIGGFLAFCYWELRVNRNWPAPAALVLVLGLVAPGLGVLLDRALMRRLRHAQLVVQLMVTVGLMLAFMGVTQTVWKPDTGRALPHFFQGSEGIVVLGVTATWHRVITVALALGIAVALRVVLYRTRLGIAMRAVVDNRDLAALNGARADVVSSAAWALGCTTAGLAGILVAPETGMVVENLTLIVLTAFAAAAIAQLRSLPMAFLGGVVVGLAHGFTGVFLSFGKNFSYVPEAIAPAILLMALLFLPQAKLETATLRPARRTERVTRPWEALLAASAMTGAVLAWANGWIPWFSGTHFGQRTEVWLGRGATFMVLGLIMLSLVPVIGWAGQISFAHFAIAGFGAAMYAHVGGGEGNPLGLVWVMLMCAPLGAIVALPALRLKGLYLALATMAFAELADKVLFRHPRIISPTASGRLYEPLDLFGFRVSSDADDRKAFLMLATVSFALLYVLLVLLRNSRWARRWIAMNDSPAASATIGVNLTTQKLVVFALSGAIAGYAGCLLGISRGALSVDSFPLFAGLPLVLLLAVQGVRYPSGAFMATVGLALFPALFELSGRATILTSIELIGPGLAAVTMAYRPEGAVFYAGRDLAALLPWRRDARLERARARQLALEAAVTRAEIGDLGLTRPFTAEVVAKLDAALGIAPFLAAHATGSTISPTPGSKAPRRPPEVEAATPVS